MPRKKLGFELNGENAYSLTDAANFLKQEDLDPEGEYYEILLYGEISAESLKELTELSYEISLTCRPAYCSAQDESNCSKLIYTLEGEEREMVLTTGTYNYTAGETKPLLRRDNSDIVFHTHPNLKEGCIIDMPSTGDFEMFDQFKKGFRGGIAHPGGITYFRSPSENPFSGVSVEELSSCALLNDFFVDEDVYFSDGNYHLKPITEISQKNINDLISEFSQKTRMEVEKASWNDEEEVENVILKIFGSNSSGSSKKFYD